MALDEGKHYFVHCSGIGQSWLFIFLSRICAGKHLGSATVRLSILSDAAITDLKLPGLDRHCVRPCVLQAREEERRFRK